MKKRTDRTQRTGEGALPQEPLPFNADPARLRREYRSEHRIGAFADSALAEAEERLQRSRKGPPPTEDEAAVLRNSPHRRADIFCQVLVSDLGAGEQETYTIVPDGEGDPLAGKVSVGSPLGRAFVHEYPGAVVEVKAPAGARLYRILRVIDP